MPEGDTVWRAARSLDRALAGQILTNTDFRVPQLAAAKTRRRVETAALPDTLTDDRSDLPAGERVALVMSGDRALARGAVDVAHHHGFRCLLALRGDAGLALVHEFMPDAVIVSRDLPQLNGEAVLDHLKRHPETRHLPVYMLSAAAEGIDGAERDLRHAGALGCLAEPATPELLGDVFDQLGHFLERRTRSVLVVEATSRNAPLASSVPIGTPIWTMEPKNPRRFSGACSTVISTAPPHSPPSARPCTTRRPSSRRGAATPTVA